MNEPIPHVLPAEIFTVFEFCLGAAAEGTLRQKVRSLGDFASIEDAFATARENAANAARKLAAEPESTPTSGSAPGLWVLATEFGYDVKRAHQTFSRFWVHSRPLSVG
jgi:hypothetical protein